MLSDVQGPHTCSFVASAALVANYSLPPARLPSDLAVINVEAIPAAVW